MKFLIKAEEEKLADGISQWTLTFYDDITFEFEMVSEFQYKDK